jgi:hypothetical protein
MPFPFTRYELDITTVARTDYEINLVGEILVIANNIIPVGLPTVSRPTIKFDERSGPEIDIMPFSVFRFPFKKLWLNSSRIADGAGVGVDHDITTNLIMYAGKRRQDLVANFRDGLPFTLARSDSSAVAAQTIEISVPLGAKSCSFALTQNTIAGGIPTLRCLASIGSSAGTVEVSTIYHKDSTGDFYFKFDCRGIRLLGFDYNNNAATGNIGGWICNFFDK